jgi:hypothetical protein
MTESEIDTLPMTKFGDLLHYLRGLGFAIAPRLDGIVDCREPNTSTVLLFRGRPDSSMMRKHELYLTRTQLAIHGLATEQEFDQALSAELQPAN